MSMMELLSQMRERARAKKQRKGSLPWFCIILSDKCVEPEKPCTECRVYEEHKEEIEKEMERHDHQDWIIKIEAVPKLVVEDGVEKVVMGENNQPVWDKERALITTKGGNYRRIVTLTDELAAEVLKGHRYFNAVEKNGKLHITGRVSARF